MLHTGRLIINKMFGEVESFPSTREALGLIPALHKPSAERHGHNASTRRIRNSKSFLAT